MVCSLDIWTDPTGASIYIDDFYIGQTDYDGYLISPGIYKIELEKTGYVPRTILNYEVKTGDIVKTIYEVLTPIGNPPIITDVTVRIYDDHAPQGVDWDIEWANGVPPFTVRVWRGDGTAGEITNVLNRYKTMGYTYDDPGTYNWTVRVTDDNGDWDEDDGTIVVDDAPTMPTYKNEIQWKSHTSEGGTWYLYTLFGNKVGSEFNYFVWNSVAYLNHPPGDYNKDIQITVPDGTSSGIYDAWTVISTSGTPEGISSGNIIAEKFDLNIIDV